MARRLSATESVGDEVDLIQLFEAEMADAEAVAREAAGGGNDGDPVVRAGVINVSSSMEVNFLPDSLFLPNFSRYTPPSTLVFSETDLYTKNPVIKYVSNPSTAKLLKYSGGNLQGNLFLEVGFVIELPFWNLNFSNKFPGTICLWDVNTMQPAKMGMFSFF